MEQFLLDLGPQRRVFTVAELNAAVRGLLDAEFGDIWVSGEISGSRLFPSGHQYFTLKDADSQIRCVCFRSTLRFLKFKPKDGVAVLARGRLDVFEARGEYQLIVEMLEPQGYGALQFAFEQLKKKLAAEGLFSQERKRMLPRYPQRIGLVTSPRGAVISDMVNILSRRFPGLHIRLFPAAVQGEGSVEDICRGIDWFSRSGWADVVIVARGGGSLEDLWTFNEEAVARAIVGSAAPVISAVGHETDVTIADFVADLRAPTPSAAAELVVRTRAEILDHIESSRHKMIQIMRYRVATASRRLHQQGVDRAIGLLQRSIGRSQQRIDDRQFRLREHLGVAIALRRRRLNEFEQRLRQHDPRPKLERQRRLHQSSAMALVQAMRLALMRRERRWEALTGKLSQLSPLTILNRGYAIVTRDDGHVVRESGEAPAGSEIRVRLAKGRLGATVTESEN